jgi:hypothetical protein
MDSDIERIIIRYYPNRALTSPLDNDAIRWDYDTNYATLKTVLAELKTLDPEIKLGTRGRYDISEEVVLIDALHVQLSYIGPYAALNHGIARELDEDEREISERLTAILARHGIRLLADNELDELVPWIQHGTPAGRKATVWDCLFVLPES